MKAKGSEAWLGYAAGVGVAIALLPLPVAFAFALLSLPFWQSQKRQRPKGPTDNGKRAMATGTLRSLAFVRCCCNGLLTLPFWQSQKRQRPKGPTDKGGVRPSMATF